MTWRIWLQAESSRQSCLARRHPRLPELGVENTPEMSDSAYYRIRRGINDVGLPNWWLLVIWYSSAVTFWYLMTCTLLNYWDSIIRILITISVKSSKGHQNSVYFIIVDGLNEMRAEARYYVDILTFSQFLIITFCRYILFQFPEEGRMVRIKVAFYWQRCLWPCHPISTTEFVRTRRLFILSIKILQPTALWRRDQVQPNCYL